MADTTFSAGTTVTSAWLNDVNQLVYRGTNNIPLQSLLYSANGTTATPTFSWCQVVGVGSSKTGCFLGAGTKDGQHLYLMGMSTFSVQILNTGVQFTGSAGSATFGTASGNISMMHLIWSSSLNIWLEVARSVV